MVIAQKAVNAHDIPENTDVVGDHDSEICPAGKRVLKIMTMPLDRHGNGCGIEPIRAISHPAATSSGSERQYLPKCIEQQPEVSLFEMPGENLRICVRDGTGDPFAQPLCRLAPKLAVCFYQQITDFIIYSGCGSHSSNACISPPF